ncbi:hypothetical protein BZA77DRAFT_40581 [Pyronema omphalodes]|nr:hypothetical protein BZA77DRAFT_40581 [Pyronema omphalodes]
MTPPLSQASSASQASSSVSQAVVPMWDSSDPTRNPPPLPPRPPQVLGSPISSSIPRTSHFDLGFNSPPRSRDTSPVRRLRAESFGGPLPPQGSPESPTRMATPGANGRKGSSPSVREVQNLLLKKGAETSPTRNSTPTPKELFGSNASYPGSAFPLKDREILLPREQYSSKSFRQSIMENDKNPVLPPPSVRSTRTPDIGALPPSQNALIRSAEFDSTPKTVTVHDISAISSQLQNISSLSYSIQREIATLSRRSADNATDLATLREAAKSRDEEIRRSLKDLQSGLTSFEATDRILGHSMSISSGSDRGSNYGDGIDVAKLASASTQALEKVLREMPTKHDQERALSILQDIQNNLKDHPAGSARIGAEEKILSVLEEIRDRESRGRELALISPKAIEDPEHVLSLLDHLREDLSRGKAGEEKIISILEEIKEKEAEERNDARILSAIDDLKTKGADERLDRVIVLLEQLRDRDPEEKVMSMLEEVRAKLEIMSEDMATTPRPSIASQGPFLKPSIPANDDILGLLRAVHDCVSGGGDIRRLVEDWKEMSSGHDKSIDDSLHAITNQMNLMIQLQQRGRQASGMSLPSQALTTTSPPLPPDLDNEAAITALANIASTTTRTDITLSSIYAFIKAFAKETNTSNTMNTEALSTLGRFLEELGRTTNSTYNNTGEVRKLLEVVRMGVSSNNDKLAEFHGGTVKQLSELAQSQKDLKHIIMGDDEEALWKVDLGVKDDVEELTRKVEQLAVKHNEALQQSSAETIEAINGSNPAALIEELKLSLGAMAQRSLEAFKNSELAVQQLKEESASNSEKIFDAIRGANGTVVVNSQADSQEIAVKCYALCQAIDSKIDGGALREILSAIKDDLASLLNQSTSSSAEIKVSIDKLREELNANMEDSLTTAITVAISDEKTFGPIRDLRQEIMDMIERTNSAIAAPAHNSETEAIKSRIESLSRELSLSMEKTAGLVAGSGLSNDVAQQIKATVDSLRGDIRAMSGTSSDGIKDAIEDMKKSVLVKVEQGLATSDKAVTCISELSQHTQESIEGLKNEVVEMMKKNISMAIVGPEKAESNKALLDAMENRITDIVVTTIAASTNADDLKEIIEAMKVDIDGMTKQLTTSPSENVLAELKEEIAKMVASSSSHETRHSVEELRKEIREVMEKVVAPVGASNIAEVIADLNSAGLEKAINELKRDVKDTLEKSMVPRSLVSQDASADHIRKSMDNLRVEILQMLQTNSNIDDQERKDVMGVMAQLKAQFGDMLIKAGDADMKTDVENILSIVEKLRNDFKDVIKSVNGQLILREPLPADDEVNVILEALREQVEELAAKLDDGEVKPVLDELKQKVEEFSKSPSAPVDNSELKTAIESLRTQIELMGSGSVVNGSDIQKDLDEIKVLLGGRAGNQDGEDIISAFNSFKSEMAKAVDLAITKLSSGNEVGVFKKLLDDFKNDISASTGKKETVTVQALEPLKRDLRELLEKATFVQPGLSSDSRSDSALKDVIDELRKDVRTMTIRSSQRNFSPASDMSLPGPSEEGESVDIFSYVRQSRVEVEMLRNLFEDKMADMNTNIGRMSKNSSEACITAKDAILLAKASATANESAIERLCLESTESAAEVKETVISFRSETRDSFAATTNAVNQFRGEARDRITEVKTVVDEIKEGDFLKKNFDDVNTLIEGAQADLKEAVEAVGIKAESQHAEIEKSITDVQMTINESQTQNKEEFLTLGTAIESFHKESSEDVMAVKIMLENAQETEQANHHQTQEKVTEVLGLVGNFQNEWKESQPDLFDSLELMKQLLIEAQEAHKELAAKPGLELPPAYDDSQAQEKLDKLIDGTEIQAKYLPQLSLLETIQKQVASTSETLAEYIKQRKVQAADEEKIKMEALHRADVELEKSRSQKYILQAATERLRDEQDKLQAQVNNLTDQVVNLDAKKVILSGELSSIETALNIRREELLMLEARGEALERRMLEGIIQQSRDIIRSNKKSKNGPSTSIPKIRTQQPLSENTTPKLDRRYFSQSQMNSAQTSPMGQKSATRTSFGNIGLGQMNYSPSLDLLGRSNSVKYTSFGAGRRKDSMANLSRMQEDRNRQPLEEEMEYADYVHIPVRDQVYSPVEEREEPREEFSEEEGSVIRNVKAQDAEDPYALGMDFSDQSRAGSRSVSVSGFSSAQ